MTGENVSYTYDSLNRLIAAATTGGVQWGESYSYDGFGNMTSKTSTKGSAGESAGGFHHQPGPHDRRLRFRRQRQLAGRAGPLTNLVNTWNVENQLISNGAVEQQSGTCSRTLTIRGGKRVLQYSVDPSYGPIGDGVFLQHHRAAAGDVPDQLREPSDPPLLQSAPMYFGGRLLAPVDRLGSVRKNRGTGRSPITHGAKSETTTPDGTDKFATYFRDGTINGVGEDYASARYYNNNFGRFWSPDPAGNAHANDPQSWNRYSYVGSDPVNRSDPTGLGSICTVWAADNSNCIVGVPTPLPFCWGGTEDDPVFTCFGEGWGTQGLPPKSSETCGTAFFSTFGLISNGEQDAVSVILGENSWNLMGTRQYSAAQSYGKGTGPVIGVSDVFLEDQYMADVILNRVAQWGGTLSSQASNPSQFNGYPAGAEKFQADMSIGADTTQCSDLLTAFSALRSQETTPRLNTSILYWGAVVWPGLNQGIAVPPGDFMIADTIFGSGPVHP